MRLIDADALIFEIQETTIQPEWCKVLTDKVIRNQPTVDAVHVIRCKDCRWGKETCGNIECNSEYHGYDWFCANGERKEE